MIKDALFGLAVGDALGVPVEFRSRAAIRQDPVTDMIGYGTYHLPPGTWSDDSSLAFCLAEVLTQGYDLDAIGQNFVKWLYHNYWTPYNVVFDVGISTKDAIRNISQGIRPELAGGTSEFDNGNGSLMRILPLIFYIKDKPIDERFQITKEVSSITHRHIRSVIGCFYYLEFARGLLNQEDKFKIYQKLQTDIPTYLNYLSVDPDEIAWYNRLLMGNIHELPDEEINGSGYVVHALEASIWCLLTTNSYREAVLQAVNLGEDTDTTAAITGGLAGILYGFESIPAYWVNQLARREDINALAARFEAGITYF
ncbi:ADP-ribosylglycohydrolase family protein [Telluribacter sp.]|uniref:ADP-ribosylglycohydrolase family protein n=1 Tax=Telluribacter sp. TaxID=1978767 RepID=UPI002E0E5FB9|nr:ADP-ribosylglycohydrolase family protein [Telluribacter sp.]